MTDSFVRPSFTLEQIRTFLAVASREHVTNAAQVLNLSQPAVTQQLQLLEKALGVQLLERIGRAVRLTNAGVEVAGACLLIMRALENLENVVNAVRGVELGTVAVGATRFAASHHLPPVVAQFSAEHPKVTVEVVVGDPADIRQQVSTGRLACALLEDSDADGGNAGLLRERVSATEVVLVANPHNPHVTRGDPLADLVLGSHYLLWSEDPATESVAAELLGEHYERASRLHFGGVDAARRAVLTCPRFIAALPLSAVDQDVRSGDLHRVDVDGLPLSVWAIRRRTSECPLVDALWQVLLTRGCRGR